MDISELYQASPVRYPELRGQVAVVTGASRGIGAGIAARLAREGMRVVLTGLEADEVKQTASGLQSIGADVLGIAGNLKDDEHIETLFKQTLEHYGTIDLLVNNAADLKRVRVEALTVSLVDTQIATNTRAPVLCAMRAAETMRSKGRGSIVNISSVGGLRAQRPGLPYGVTKGALDAMTRVLAMDLGEYGIRVNGVAPGWTPTKVSPEKDGDYLREVSEYIALRRPGTPGDIGSAVAFLASNDASYITGHTLYVDGGLTIQLHPPGQPI